MRSLALALLAMTAAACTAREEPHAACSVPDPVDGFSLPECQRADETSVIWRGEPPGPFVVSCGAVTCLNAAGSINFPSEEYLPACTTTGALSCTNGAAPRCVQVTCPQSDAGASDSGR